MRNSGILLVGMRGSGKTTLGALLARELGLPFMDTDLLVEELAGEPIEALINQRGIPYFRALEEKALMKALARTPAVIATGGGFVDLPRAAELCEGHLVIHLHCDRERALARLARVPRPPLTGDPLPKEYDAVYERRRDTYFALGGTPVETGEPTVEESLHACKQLWQQYHHNDLR